jgi:gamma-glutamyltranspeptidase/glutathione hydrolase
MTTDSTSPPFGRGDRLVGANFATRAPVLARRGMVATAQPLATGIGLDILKRGGNAVDAAIAVNAALGLMEPTACGIGGDMFAIIWDPKSRQLHGYNGSGRSALGRSYEDLKDKLGGRKKIPLFGSLTVTVPGAVDGWFALHEKFGSRKIEALLEPAIAYAREGFPVSQLVAHLMERDMQLRMASEDVEEKDNAKGTYLVNGATPKEGQIFRNPDLAMSYEILAQGGRDAFYRGALATVMDRYFRRIGGDLRLEDLAAHRGEWVTPVSVNYRGYDVFELPPNGQGAAALQMLNIVEGYDLRAMGAGSADALHVMIEAKRLVYEDLAKYYGDPAFVTVPLDRLLSTDYARERRKSIDMARVNPAVGPGDPTLARGGTTYFTVADKDGMMVSFIQSNFRGMGSGLVPDRLGFMFHHRGEHFSLDPNSPNVYAPGKRPFHTIIPAFVMKDGEPFLSFGVMGGDMQPQGHVQVLVNLIDFGMNLQEAGDFLRFRHYGGTEATGDAPDGVGWVEVEDGLPPETRAELERRGHRLKKGSIYFGGYQAIMRDRTNDVYWGASEMRKDGHAAGY